MYTDESGTTPLSMTRISSYEQREKRVIAPDMRKSQVTHLTFWSGAISASMTMYGIGTHPATTPQPPRLDNGLAFPIVLVAGFVTGFYAKMVMFYHALLYNTRLAWTCQSLTSRPR